ncbi:hypothetical protein WA171_004125, partial [Blastocystis sp. BT1]
MGQQFSGDGTITSVNKEFVLPSWYNPNHAVTHATISVCKSSISILSRGDQVVFQRIRAFGYSLSPAEFLYRQLFYRLAVLSPRFLRDNLRIDSDASQHLRTSDILQSEVAHSFFDALLINPILELAPYTSQEDIDAAVVVIVNRLNIQYGIDASLYSDIAFIIMNVLSDCMGGSFETTSQSWTDVLSKILQTFVSLNLVNKNHFGTFSIRETMLQLGQPFIDWSNGLLGTGYNLVDNQHQWLLTIVNVLIHVCTKNTMQINLDDVLDALCDYTCIHFTEEEMLFMNNPNYSERDLHKAQHIDFLNTIVNLKKEIGIESNGVLSKQTLDYMINWLTNHIRTMDRRMVEECL